MDIKPLVNEPELPVYKSEKNSEALYIKINDLIDPMDQDVRNTAVNIAKNHEGMYNVYQVCEIFQFIKENISYVNDPRGNENYWSAPYQTVDVGAGDCEDQSVLFGALISAIGGTGRIYLTDSHAFAGIYVGNSITTRDEILSAINSYYDADLRFAWLEDELGYWLIIDTINAMHPGGLPLGAEPLNSASSDITDSGILKWVWDFFETESFHIIDVI
jgi:transglutaminase-like putative cysteine protease